MQKQTYVRACRSANMSVISNKILHSHTSISRGKPTKSKDFICTFKMSVDIVCIAICTHLIQWDKRTRLLQLGSSILSHRYFIPTCLFISLPHSVISHGWQRCLANVLTVFGSCVISFLLCGYFKLYLICIKCVCVCVFMLKLKYSPTIIFSRWILATVRYCERIIYIYIYCYSHSYHSYGILLNLFSCIYFFMRM